MAPDTRAEREARHNATEPATSAGSHDTVGRTTSSFGPPKETTAASAWSDISRMSYISPANVGFDPTDPIAPYERPMAPTPGISPSSDNTPAPFKSDYLLSDLLPSSRAPSSCDFGTLKDFGTSKNFAHTPVFGPSPPFVPKTRGRAAFQARCETASPSSETLSRFLRDFTSEVCEEDAHEEDALPMVPATNSPITCEPTTIEQAHVDAVTTDSPITHKPTTIEQDHVDAFTNWSLYAVPGNILADFVSGTLKFSQLDQDGNPVFVKDNDTNTSSQQQSSNSHKDVNAVHVSQDEIRIFVSMDQLRKQIAELQEHDEAMEREADKAHQEKARLELQLQEVRGTCRKASSDSAIGSDSDDDIRKRAQAEKLKRMQKRLDEANTLANSQHVHIDALTAERDELIKECHLAHAHKKVLIEQNQVHDKENQTLQKENQIMKSQIQQAGQYFISIENEATQLKSENDRLRQQISQMYQQNDSLRKTRKSHSDQIKNLQSELEATRGQLGDTIRDTQSLRNKNRENDAYSEQIEKLKAELEATRGQLSNARKDNEVLRGENKEQIELLKTELEETRGQLGDTTNDIKILVRKNKEIKAERDKIEGFYESLQENYTVIRRKLREDSTVNSVSSTASSTGSVVRTRRPASIQIKRTAAPTAATKATTAAAPRVSSTPATATTQAPTAPASSVASDNEDHTIRPAYEPLENMRILISTTESEVARLQKKLDEKNAESKAMHKGYSRRTWERLHQEKVALESAIHEKSKIIYHQYDLLEGIRRKGRV